MELNSDEQKKNRFVEKSTGIVLNGGDRLGNSTVMIGKGIVWKNDELRGKNIESTRVVTEELRLEWWRKSLE